MQNWPKLLKEVEKKYFCLFLVYLLYYQSENAIGDKIDATIKYNRKIGQTLKSVANMHQTGRRFIISLKINYSDQIRI